MLEELSIVEVNFGGMDSIYIQSDLLKKLCIEFYNREDECTIVIDAPNLEYFVYAGSKVSDFAIKSFKSLHSASLDFDLMGGFSNDSYSREAKIFEECSIANRLCLYGAAVLALDSVTLCTFPNLTCLALGSVGSWYKCEMLAHFLQKAPKLESLKFEKELDVHARWDVGAFAAFESVLHEFPVCLKRSLKKIELLQLHGHEDEIKLIEYFLKNGRVLQEVVVVYYRNPLDPDILSRFSGCPKCSTKCQVLFKEGDNETASYPDNRRQWF
ncbi:unnamed protein product [Cuscuta campestris]|nr:unnamed protein product [Cuscuta campestris]